MTTFQKTLLASAIAAIVGTGIYQTRELSHLHAQVQAPQAQTPSLPDNSPQSAPDAPAHSAAIVPTRPRPAAAAPQVASSKKKAASPGGFLSSEYYALLTNKVSHLTLAQVEPYLKAKGRSAPSLLAGFRATGDHALLAEALQKHPGDPQVGFEVATRNDALPDERRAGLDSLKQAAPDNSLANYLSALDHFKAGQKEAAAEDLNAAAAKPLFNDYMLERTQASEELYRAAGYPPGEAQMIANAFLPEAQLVQVRELGQNMVSLAASYQQTGDQSAHDTALQMALNLGQRLDDPAAGETQRWQLIGIRVERAALSTMDPNSPVPGTTQLVQDRLDQIAQQMQSIQDLAKQADPIWKTLSDEDWTSFHARVAASGEEAAVRWLVSNYGSPNH